ncbi:MAG: hypothetical protein GF398_07165 [Chitinivibrionales bacterium]|nr:hypothetical protein [Chitinivibrionales bacterium]
MKQARIDLAAIISLMVIADFSVAAPTGAMRHEGRTQAIIDEFIIPPPTLPYNHEGTMSVLRNGNIINTWQASHCEGCSFGFAMMNIFDGEKWLRYSRKADAGDYNWAPVPYQPRKAGEPLLLFVHLNSGWGGPETFVKTSYDNGWTWNEKVMAPKIEDPVTFWTQRTNGIAYPCTYTRPLEFPDGSLLAGSNAYEPCLTYIPSNNYTGNKSGGDPWKIIKPPQYTASQDPGGCLGGPVLAHSDDYSSIQYIIWAWGSKPDRTCWSSDGGDSFGSWTGYSGAGCDHVHAVALDEAGGALKGWYALAYDGGNRSSFDVAISQDGRTWQNVLQLGRKGQGMGWHSELTAQGIVQTPDRRLHVTCAGRGGFYVWHVIIDPDILVNNSRAGNSGSISFCGGGLKGNEVSDSQEGIAFTVVRNGGTSGAASVRYRTVDGDATAGADYESTTGLLQWSDGDNSSKTVYVPIMDDSDAEGSESFYVVLSDVSGASMGGVDSMQIVINDGGNRAKFKGDSPVGAGLAQFSHREYFSYEDAIDETLWVVIERPQYDQTATVATSVSYSTSDGSAKAGQDYIETSGTVSWPMVTNDRADNGPRNIGIPIMRDPQFKGNKTFSIELSNPTGGAVLGTRRKALCTIVEATLDGATQSALSRRRCATAMGVINVAQSADRSIAVTFDGTVRGAADISLIHVSGRVVKSIRHASQAGLSAVEISTRQLPPGAYIVNVHAESHISVHKMLFVK